MTQAQQGTGDRAVRFVDAPTRTASVAGAGVVYRELGSQHGGVPLVALTHLGANLDSWDPELIDALARERRVILLSYRGVGASTGAVRRRFEDTAADAIAATRALGLSRVDLFGLSMGGMVAQEILHQDPDLVERVILAGTGPQGGPGLTGMTGVTVRAILRGIATFTNPTTLLFFTRTRAGREAARTYHARLKLRRSGRDERVTPGVFRAQLRAVNRWGHQTPPVTSFTRPVLILHGDHDRMVPTGNTDALLAQYPHAQVRIFADAGHGVAFQNRDSVARIVTGFLQR
ncbi:alpha/beta fold hydrolase [Microbacterium oleivorans]|uniref:Alpha/beta hydrolase n=1 Tax=Microbacterium oleivorans TaxID=273677 RepID=A0A7D5F680_9MICO|nr:alpha/beta hydrolase [Microbacterium oleivorans]QLD12807.1 alpha/beta hydrolase [Microbacterium oleivorans]